MKPYSVDDEEVMMFWKDLDGGGDFVVNPKTWTGR